MSEGSLTFIFITRSSIFSLPESLILMAVLEFFVCGFCASSYYESDLPRAPGAEFSFLSLNSLPLPRAWHPVTVWGTFAEGMTICTKGLRCSN